MSDEVRVVVARAIIVGEARVEVVAPPIVKARIGDSLVVQFHYAVQEGSKEKEAWSFRLSSRIGTQRPEPVQSNFADKWGLKDRVEGVLQQGFVLKTRGQFDAEFQVEARYDHGAWRKPGQTEQLRSGRGAFQFQVDQ